jgi:DNA polymerase-1
LVLSVDLIFRRGYGTLATGNGATPSNKTTEQVTMPTLLAIDGNSLMHRAFHAIPTLNAPDGSYTNAVYGFMNMLLRLLKENKPSHVAVAFDMYGPTFRHESFADYKAGRAKTPDELIGQFDLLRRVLHAMNIAVLEKEGYEADDFLGALSKLAGEKGIHALLVTGDRDAWQLIDDNTSVIYTKRGITETEVLDAAGVEALLGVSPDRVADLKGLMGDSSDNIPGIPGVGAKTAVKLLAQFGTLENVIQNADQAGSLRLTELIKTHAEQARMSKALGTIETNIEGLPPLDTLAFSTSRAQGGADIIREFGMTSLMTRVKALAADMPDALTPHKDAKTTAQALVQAVGLKSAAELLSNISGAKRVAFLLDADGLSVADKPDRVFFVPFSKTLLNDGADEDDSLSELSVLFADEGITKILYDSKALRHRLFELGITVEGPIEDVMLMAYVEDSGHGQDGLLAQCLNHGIDCPDKADASSLWQLFDAIDARLIEEGTDTVYREIELPLCFVLYKMEQRGFSVDLPALKALSDSFGLQIDVLQKEVERLAGHPFNLNSPKQVGTVLFEELKLPTSRKTKSGFSTDAASLDLIADAHPIVDKLLEFRTLSKLKSTYLEGLRNVTDTKTGKVHTRFTQNVTSTGRISSLEPNLQNIPVRTEVGREIRRAFVSGEKGRVLVTADYSQIELRLLAHMANEQHMIEVFLNNGDIHTATAARVFGLPENEVSKAQRSSAKAVNFGIIYGISDFGLARNLGIARSQAAKIISDYNATYPHIHAFMLSCIEFGKKNGYVETLFGRRRYLPELAQKNYTVRAFGERAAMNAPFQGTAADLIKVAMIRVEQRLSVEAPDAKLILQVHDELIVDCRRGDADKVAAIVTECMQNVLTLSVPLSVEIGIGENWLEAK